MDTYVTWSWFIGILIVIVILALILYIARNTECKVTYFSKYTSKEWWDRFDELGLTHYDIAKIKKTQIYRFGSLVRTKYKLITKMFKYE